MRVSGSPADSIFTTTSTESGHRSAASKSWNVAPKRSRRAPPPGSAPRRGRGSRGSMSTIRTSRMRLPNRLRRDMRRRRTMARWRTSTRRSAACSTSCRTPGGSIARSSSSPRITARRLGDHGERTHGLFAYESTLRVPLIVWCRDRIRAGVHRRSGWSRRRRANDPRSARRRMAGGRRTVRFARG